jgi:N-formylglutamate amidohydrolase
MENNQIYTITLPPAGTIRLPVVLSIPHCGTLFPADLAPQYKQELLPPDDTDWLVDRLYAFAPAMGIPVISALYSRWVIDLNRDPQSKPLYDDGRVITGLCTTTNFLGAPIYTDERAAVGEEEVNRRRQLYFEPYHQKVQELLDETRQQQGKVLLWDCHSIRQLVPSINSAPFADLILGSVDGHSASPQLVENVLTNLTASGYSVGHNHPFKGGYITRSFGKPEQQQHALQLEMSKVNYMEDNERDYSEERAAKMQLLLKQTILAAIQILER